MKKYFAVSDVHSFYSPLMKALNDKGFDKNNSDHLLIVCGDAFDRGSETKEMLSFLMEMSSQNRLIYVRGNHEDLLESCFTDMKHNRPLGTHHRTNGTILTIASISDYTEWDISYRTYEWKTVRESVERLLEFINNTCVDYFELGNTIFVHGWIPVEPAKDRYGFPTISDDWKNGDWREARWPNGMQMWRFGLVPKGSTIVCGHWHCSYGWSHIDHKYKEFPNPSHADFNYSFKPYIREGIVAIDACTAFTGKVNCVVFNEQGEIINE